MFVYINTYTQDRSYTQYTCTYIPNIKYYIRDQGTNVLKV